MKIKLATSLIAILFSVNAIALQATYLGKDHNQYQMRYKGELYFKDSNEPTEAGVRNQIEKQIKFLFGSMQSNSIPGAPKWNHDISNVEWVLIPKENITDIYDYKLNDYHVTYNYEGTVVIGHQNMLSYEFDLPKDPNQIYKQSLITIADKTYSPCSDINDNDESKFWYYFNKNNFRCNLKADKELVHIRASLEKIENESLVTPNYDKLVNENGEILVHILVGPLVDTDNLNPITSWDPTAHSFKTITQLLSWFGYTASNPWTAEQISAIYPSAKYNKNNNPYVIEYTKQEKKALLRIRLFYGATGIKENSSAFHYFYKNALAKASVIMYIGHSGLGKNLKHSEIVDYHDGEFEFDINPDKYQIFLISSCSSYAYFNEKYLEIKNPDSLNVITFGLSVRGGDVSGSIGLINALQAWSGEKETQDFKRMFNAFPDESLIGVNQHLSNKNKLKNKKDDTAADTSKKILPIPPEYSYDWYEFVE